MQLELIAKEILVPLLVVFHLYVEKVVISPPHIFLRPLADCLPHVHNNGF